MEIANLVIQVVDLLSPSLARQMNYIRNVGDNMKELERKMDELACLDKDVRDMVTSAEWKAKKPKEEVNNWLQNVEETKVEVSKIKNELEENGRYLMGCLPNCCSRRKIGKRTLKLIKEVNDLYNKRSFEGGVIASPPPAKAQILRTTSLVGSTAEQNFNLIWDLLMEENTGMIGIYGMGGVGKTTVMKNINNQLGSTEEFDIVIWVTMSKDFNLRRLQGAIAERLNLPKDLGEEGLSIQLHEVLCQKKFLLVLDDLWHQISLEQVGIPKLSVDNGCKVVLTTRSRRVCRSMEANKFIEIKKLSDEEAWLLFKEKVGATALVDSNVEVVAKQVANECDGLPLAIIVVGRALRGVSDVGQWRHALYKLKNSKPEIGEMEDEVIEILRFSYQYLKSEKLRACFLYCSLFPEDYNVIEYTLINFWICEGFIEEHGDKQAMVDEGQSILNELLEACMLERSGNCSVKMHDLMRDMGIGITRKSPIFMVKAGIGLEKVVADKEWAEDIERISLMRNKIKMISGEPPKCPKLVTLFLNQNPISHFISHSFFQHMNQLRVLDLSNTQIEELPESISGLENLHMLSLRWCRKLNTIPSLAKLKELRTLNLCFSSIEVLPDSLSGLEKLNLLLLAGCKLKRVPCLAKLKNLTTLSLSGTCIEELPKRMEELAELRVLNLNNTIRLRWFPIEILPKLSLLEHFLMQGSSFLWSSSSSNEVERMEGRIGFEEVTTLTRLVEVSFDFVDISSFRKFAASMQGSLSKLEYFEFRVAKPLIHNTIGDFILTLRKHRYQLKISIEEFEEDDMKTGLPQFLLDLRIMEVVELMTRCEIKYCKGMEWLLVAHDYDNYNEHHPLLLSKVEVLKLEYMFDLRALQKGNLLHGTWPNLQELIIRGCPKLKNLFSLGTLQSLQNLKKVLIHDCSAMEEVVVGEEDDKTGFNTVLTLPNLKSISLYNLPALKSICSRTMICSSLTTIKIILCCRLKKIPLIIDKPRPRGLTTKLGGTREWWDALDWADLAHTKDLLESFYSEKNEEEEKEAAEIEDIFTQLCTHDYY